MASNFGDPPFNLLCSLCGTPCGQRQGWNQQSAQQSCKADTSIAVGGLHTARGRGWKGHPPRKVSQSGERSRPPHRLLGSRPNTGHAPPPQSQPCPAGGPSPVSPSVAALSAPEAAPLPRGGKTGAQRPGARRPPTLDTTRLSVPSSLAGSQEIRYLSLKPFRPRTPGPRDPAPCSSLKHAQHSTTSRHASAYLLSARFLRGGPRAYTTPLLKGPERHCLGLRTQ